MWFSAANWQVSSSAPAHERGGEVRLQYETKMNSSDSTVVLYLEKVRQARCPLPGLCGPQGRPETTLSTWSVIAKSRPELDPSVSKTTWSVGHDQGRGLIPMLSGPAGLRLYAPPSELSHKKTRCSTRVHRMLKAEFLQAAQILDLRLLRAL